MRSLVLILLLAFPVQAPAEWQEGDVLPIALLVGSNKGAEELVDLRYAERDAEKIRDVFWELGGLAPERTRMLLGGDADDLTAALDEVAGMVRRAKASGHTVMLVFYYSGHAKEGRLLLDDSDMPMRRVKDWLKESTADVRVAFVDACQSGELTRMKGGTLAPSMVKVEHTKGQIIVTSSAAAEGSQESDEIGGSFFTHYLSSGLRGAADHSGDGSVSLREVYEYAYNQTVNRTATTRGGTQHPTYGYQVAGHGEIILTRMGMRSCGIVFAEEVSGKYLIYDLTKRRIVAEVIKSPGEKRAIAVPPGKFAVKKRRESDYLLGEFALESGQTLTVQDGLLRAVAFEEDTTKGLVALKERTLFLSYSLRGGAEFFFDAPSRDELFYSSAQVGLQVEFLGLLSRRLSLAVDVLFGMGQDETGFSLSSGVVQTVEASFRRIQLGAAMHYHLDWKWWGLYAGPRLTLVIASRSFGAPLENWPVQTFATLCPGATLGAILHLGNFDLFLEGRVHYLYHNVGEDSSLGYGGAYLGVAYRH